MNQKEKQLLIKDLCARLLYGVICRLSDKSADVSITEKLGLGGLDHFIYGTMDVLPYLRSMSSMTEEEKKDLSKVLNYEFYIDDDFALVAEDDRHRIRLELCDSYINWLLAHHFDFRGLIPMGLALEAPKDMYKNK